MVTKLKMPGRDLLPNFVYILFSIFVTKMFQFNYIITHKIEVLNMATNKEYYILYVSCIEKPANVGHRHQLKLFTRTHTHEENMINASFISHQCGCTILCEYARCQHRARSSKGRLFQGYYLHYFTVK